MSKKNPIKFLDSYSRDDKDIFFGRDKETSDLYEKVGKSKIVLLYGLSGTGKTSLINCGLENRYEAGQQIFIYVRRGTNLIHSFKQAISSEASSLIHPKAGPAEALESLYFDFLKPITIVFDQFEELFISGDYDEKQSFISTIATIFHNDLRIKFIFSLREEYLAHMDEFEQKIPMIYDHRLRLEKMRRSTLEEVISKIVEKGEAELESEEVPGMIIDNISDRKGYVELPYLQVYLDKMTRLMNSIGKGKVFTIKLVEKAGKLEDVLGDFLEEQITRIASEIDNKEVVNDLLKQLITPDGTKKQLSFDDIKPYAGISVDLLKEILEKLEQSRIIKLEDGIYELSHDSLAKKIAEKRTTEEIQLIEVIKFLRNAANSYRQTETLLDSKQLKYVHPYLHLIDLSADETELLDKSHRKARNRKVALGIVAGVVTAVLIVGGFFMQHDKYKTYMAEASDAMKNANYFEAKLNFQRAVDVLHFIPKNEAKANITLCDTLINREKPYRNLIKVGDSLFNLGVINYHSAFEMYHLAEEKRYDSAEITNLIRIRKKEATKKLRELALIEYESTHRNIAFALISEAYVHGGSKEDSLQIERWLGELKKGDLDMVIDQLQSVENFENEENERADTLLNKYLEKQTALKND